MSKHVRFGLFALALLAAVGLIAPTHAEVPAETEPLFAEVPADGCVVDATASPLDVPAEQEPFMASCASGYTCPNGMVIMCPQFIGYSVNCVNGCCNYWAPSCDSVCIVDNECNANERCDNGCCTEVSCSNGPTCQKDSDCITGQSCSGGCCKDPD